jgi:hypothetical protein
MAALFWFERPSLKQGSAQLHRYGPAIIVPMPESVRRPLSFVVVITDLFALTPFSSELMGTSRFMWGLTMVEA